MITDGDNQYELAKRILSRLLQGITSKNNADYCYISCLYSFRTENKLILHENPCNNYGHCHVEIPEKFDIDIL